MSSINDLNTSVNNDLRKLGLSIYKLESFLFNIKYHQKNI